MANKKRKIKKREKKIIVTLVAVFFVLIAGFSVLIIINNKIFDNKSKFIERQKDYCINVLLTNDGAYDWNSFSVLSDKGMEVICDGVSQFFEVGEVYYFDPYIFNNDTSKADVIIKPKTNDGCLNIIDENGHNKGFGYPGTIIISNRIVDNDVRTYIINSVSLEEYTGGVVSSEMPDTFGKEALKAQAVCARSYGVSHIGSLVIDGLVANVDDTTSYQVYQNEKPTDLSKEAVLETEGEIMTFNGSVVETLFYSTSPGYSQTQKSYDYPFLSRKHISLSNDDPLRDAGVPVNDEIIATSKDIENSFKTYFMNRDENAIEKDDKYFRWDTILDMKANHDKVCQKIIDFYLNCVNSNYSNINQKVVFSSGLLKAETDKNANSLTPKGFGEFKYFEVEKRSSGGCITNLKLVFENGSLELNDELVIRKVLGEASSDVKCNDGSIMKSTKTLYSSAFTYVANEKGYHIYGGGFGHGCGMSQYAAKNLAEIGMNYYDILTMFFGRCKIEKIQNI